MNGASLRNIAIAGTDTYLQYMNHHDLGKQRIPVHSISILSGNNIALVPAKPLVNPVETAIWLNGVALSDCHIESYDFKRGIAVVVGDTEVLSLANPRDITLVNNLTFLVQRFLDWFLEFPLKNFSNHTHQITEESIQVHDSNPQQVDAIQGLLTHPLTYVCGPPGSGKTQQVMAYAMPTDVKSSTPPSAVPKSDWSLSAMWPTGAPNQTN